MPNCEKLSIVSPELSKQLGKVSPELSILIDEVEAWNWV